MKKLIVLAILFSPIYARAMSYDSGGAGVFGVYISSTSAAASAATSTQFGNVAQITLTAGDWDVSGVINIAANGGTVTVSQGAISTFSGNTITDHVAGDNLMDSFLATATINGTVSIPTFRMVITSSTIVYLKAAVTYAVATPLVKGRISARRVL